MITKLIWHNILFTLFVKEIFYLIAVILTPLSILLDLLLLPLEIIAVILYKVVERSKYE